LAKAVETGGCGGHICISPESALAMSKNAHQITGGCLCGALCYGRLTDSPGLIIFDRMPPQER
jgi:hypothetical protein